MKIVINQNTLNNKTQFITVTSSNGWGLVDLKLLSNWYILTKGMLKYYMDAKYHKAANVVSGCKANPNLDSLMKYKNDWEISNIHGGVSNGTPDSYSGDWSPKELN